jgi:hypothetical protein
VPRSAPCTPPSHSFMGVVCGKRCEVGATCTTLGAAGAGARTHGPSAFMHTAGAGG